MARSDGLVMEHRLVMAMHLDRILTPREVVHHADGNRRNNALDNLVLFPDNTAYKRANWGEIKLNRR
jgi:hypothetical protein